MTLELPRDLASRLSAKAGAEGVSIDLYVKNIVERDVLSGPLPSFADLPPDDWIREFRAWTESHRHLPVLAGEAISRESIYSDRGL
ncbi:MAG: hypothetical protein U0Q16_27685 [Bryobacteraceae bacterium]